MPPIESEEKRSLKKSKKKSSFIFSKGKVCSSILSTSWLWSSLHLFLLHSSYLDIGILFDWCGCMVIKIVRNFLKLLDVVIWEFFIITYCWMFMSWWKLFVVQCLRILIIPWLLIACWWLITICYWLLDNCWWLHIDIYLWIVCDCMKIIDIICCLMYDWNYI